MVIFTWFCKTLVGGTLVAEIPDPQCVNGQSPYFTEIQNARKAFVGLFGDSTYFKKLENTVVTVTGIGFFATLNHRATGAAPNGIELHPVTAFDVVNPGSDGRDDPVADAVDDNDDFSGDDISQTGQPIHHDLSKAVTETLAVLLPSVDAFNSAFLAMQAKENILLLTRVQVALSQRPLCLVHMKLLRF